MARKYPCSFCNEEFNSKAARRKHNKLCEKNVDREKNRAICEAGKERFEKSGRRVRDYPTMDAETFSACFDDLPDGAFFAMAAENGLEPEDFV